MSKSKELKYRAICHMCKHPFDARTGKLNYGLLICSECHNKIPFTTF